MHPEAFRLEADDGTTFHVNRWTPAMAPRAMLMVVHGMAEHSGRYARFAEALVEAGIAVYAHDQRGHGRTLGDGIPGHFADEAGWARVIDDLNRLERHIHQRYPGTPIVLFGHSMGSYIAQAYLMHHAPALQGAILSGSNYQPRALYRAAGLVARVERWRLGRRRSSRLLQWLSFGAFNRAFEPSRTPYDWLSADPEEVDAYLADPLCGFACTTPLWINLLDGLGDITPIRHLARIDPDLPILVIGGERDPVSAGKRLVALAGALRKAGVRDVKLRVYSDARHELLNETIRDEVTLELRHWLEQTLAYRRRSGLPLTPPRRPAEPAQENPMTQVSNYTYDALEVGQTAHYEKEVEERDVQLFAALSGDRNPVHLDADYAAGTVFKERIAHGMFTGAVISAAIACELPGPGTVYLGQNLRFTRPVKLGDRLRVDLEVLEKLPKNRVRIATRVFNQNEEQVVDGEAEVLAPKQSMSIDLPDLPPIHIG